jgi:FkbM family methyltransferase
VSGYHITCDLRDGVQRALFYCGTYEPQTTALISAVLRPGDTFLDIGANVGHYTFLAARLVGPGGRVVAIEASPSTAGRLDADVRRNGLAETVTVCNAAAGDATSDAFLYDSDDPAQVGMRHLDPIGRGRAIEKTRVIRLDQLLPAIEPDVVKLDVEGGELRALSGMREILASHPPRLIVAETQEPLLARFGDSVEALGAFLADFDYDADEVGERWHSDSHAFRLRPP